MALEPNEHEHYWIQDPSTLENVCRGCGIVQAPNDIPEVDLDIVDKTNPVSSNINKEGFLVAHASHVDFSNGGFLSTKIDARSVDCQGKSTDRCYTNKLKYNHNNMLSSANPPTLKNSIWRVSALGDRLNIPKHIQERAAEIFHKAYGRKASVHNSMNMVCACIYFACKEGGLNKKLRDIAEVIAEEEKDIKPIKRAIFACYEKLVDSHGVMQLKIPKHFRIPDDITLIGNRIGLPETTIRYALDMYYDVREKDRIIFAGKSNKITSIILLYISASIHNDFIRDDDLESELFIEKGGAGISEYILQRKANEYLADPAFAGYAEKVQKRKILLW